jgi:hypothetical protein
MTDAYRILVRKRNGKKPLGKWRYIWEDNIKMDIEEIRWEGTNWIHLAYNSIIDMSSGHFNFHTRHQFLV